MSFNKWLIIAFIIEVLAILTLGYVLVSFAPSIGCLQTGPAPQFWGPAPNGVYYVLFYEVNSTPVYFPYCPSYGGQLHGEYEVLEELLPLHGWYYATLENNVIINVNL